MIEKPSDGDYGLVRCKGNVVLEGKVHVDEDGLLTVRLSKPVGNHQQGELYPIKWDDVEGFQKLTL